MADKEQELGILQEINDALEKQVEYETRIARIRGEERSDLDRQLDTLVKRQEIQQQLATILAEDDFQARKKSIDLMEAEAEAARKRGTISVSAYQTQLKLVKELREATEGGNVEALVALKKRVKAQGELNKKLQQTTKAMIAGKKAGSGMAESLAKITGIAGEGDTVFGELLKSVNVFDKGIKGAFKGGMSVGKNFFSTMSKEFSLLNAAAFQFNNIIEVGLAFEKLQIELSQTTGAYEGYIKSTEMAQKANATLGITLSDTFKATGDLYEEFERFTTYTATTKTEIIGLAANLEKVGISANTTARSLNFMVSELGQSLPEAMETMEEFAVVGKQMGIPPRELAETFSNIGPQLSIFGNRTKTIFMQSAEFSKRLGLSVGDTISTIKGLSDRLGTFEGAAQGVASLNIALGGSFINAFDLAMAKTKGPMAQMYMLRDAIQASGKSLDDLGVFAKEFLEKELGERFGTLRALLEGEEIDEATIKTEAKTLEEQVSDNTAASTKLTAMTEASVKNLTENNQLLKDSAKKAADMVDAMGGLQYAMYTLSGALAVMNAFSGIASIRNTRALQRMTGRGVDNIVDTGRGTMFKTVPGAAKGSAKGTSKAVSAAEKRIAMAKGSKITQEVVEGGAEAALKQGGKVASKKIPFGVGTLFALGLAADRLLEGDILGAGLETASGVASAFPGVGTMGSFAIDSAIIARDTGAFDSASEGRAMADPLVPKRAADVTRNVTTENLKAQRSLINEISQLNTKVSKLIESDNKQDINIELYLDKTGRDRLAHRTIEVINHAYS